MQSISPEQVAYWLTPGRPLFFFIHVLGVTCFTYIVYRRLIPLLHAQRDDRFGDPWRRAGLVLKYWFGQWKHPRYRFAGTLHILIFGSFLVLVARAFIVLFGGLSESLAETRAAVAYDFVTDYAATVVFVCVLVAIFRRSVLKPQRYAVPASRGASRSADAIFLLALIAILMVADSGFAATKSAFEWQHARTAAPGILSLAWMLRLAFISASVPTIRAFYISFYLLHQTTFYFLLCYRPFGIQFHVETSLFNVYFAKLDRDMLKPVRWGVAEDELDEVKSFGVKTYEDFTWKHLLDFYSCADCGRCSDNCPSATVGRSLSPRFFTRKARYYAFQHYPMFGKAGNGAPLVGGVYSEDEIWSCTTCGACEEECPLLIEYIDKIVDLRRGLVDDGNVPQSLQKPLKALESRGNPYGKMEKKRAEWASAPDFQRICPVRTLEKTSDSSILFFVDSITSYDDRMQSIARSTAQILSYAGERFGILGAKERDSGNEVRRFGEELLFLALRDHNTSAIRTSGVRRIVTADPHAFNTLKRDYRDLPPVEHISQWMAARVRSGALKFRALENKNAVYTYHDPCYLGRHNQVYDDPRAILDAIPGMRRVEMRRSRDRSFCCGGGGLALFYEPKEEERIAVKRVRMAEEAGANVIVTACPFCMVNVEDAIKVAGLEGMMSAIDLVEIAQQQLEHKNPQGEDQHESELHHEYARRN